MSQQMRVFVSHSHEDDAFCRAVVNELRNAGADVWYDGANLGAGHLRRTIMKELADRPVFVVLLSKAALASKWVLDECEWAYELQQDDPARLILPIVVAPLGPTDLNVVLYLRSLKRVEAGDLHPLSVVEAARQALRLLGLPEPGQPPSLATLQLTESMAELSTRGRELMAQNQFYQAISLFERLTQLNPSSLYAWANLGYAYSELGYWQEANAVYDRLLAIDLNDAVAWNNKANALNGLGMYVEAFAAADRALALDGESAASWCTRGESLAGLKRYEEALEAYNRAIAIQPNIWRWKHKAAALRALGREIEAQDAERHAQELDTV